MISARSLTKRYGDFVAVDGIDFDIAPGSRSASSAPTARASPRRCG
ncbi:hypothetical protein [Tessaracoccus coleopterorum]